MITLLAIFLACSTDVAEENTTNDAQDETTEQVDTTVKTPEVTQVNAKKSSETLGEIKKDLDDTIKTLDEVKVLVKDLDGKNTDETKDNNTNNNENNGDKNETND